MARLIRPLVVNTLAEAHVTAGDSADAAAEFDRLLNVERTRLYGIAYAVLGNHADAEDALQDAVSKAWRSWNSMLDTQGRKAWLTRVCVNEAIDHRRRIIRIGAAPPSEETAAPADPRFEGRLVDLDNAFMSLSRQQRAAIVLHHRHGHTIDECAQLMGCSAGSVRTHIHRALAALRKAMTDD